MTLDKRSVYTEQPPTTPGWYYILLCGADEPIILNWDGNIWSCSDGLPFTEGLLLGCHYGPLIPKPDELT